MSIYSIDFIECSEDIR